MGTKILDYCKGLCKGGAVPMEWALTPEIIPVLMDALGVTDEYKKQEVTFENLWYYIDRQVAIGEIDDARLVKNIFANEKYDPAFINVEFLAQIMESPDFLPIMEDENAKSKIFEKYSALLNGIEGTDAESIVLQSENFMTLAEHCRDENKRKSILQNIQAKINEVKDTAANIKTQRDLLKFRAIRYNENHLKRNLRFVLENFRAVYGEDVGNLFTGMYSAMYDEGGNDREKQIILDSIVFAFDAKMMALRKAWGVGETEALHNFMVEV
jgi:hypothetical protein